MSRSALLLLERWRDADDLRWSARQWALRVNVPLRSVQVREMRTKWASVSAGGRLTLNSELLERPRSEGEYAIVHELVHLLCPAARHGRLFKSYLNAFLPDWEARHIALQGYRASYFGPPQEKRVAIRRKG